MLSPSAQHVLQGGDGRMNIGGNFISGGGGGSFANDYQLVSRLTKVGSSGAYIDLGFAFDTACDVEIGYYVGGASANFRLFGATENSGARRCAITLGDGSLSYGYGSNGTSFIHASVAAVHSVDSVAKFKLEAGTIKLDIDGTVGTGTSQAAYSMANNLYLFGQNYNGAYRDDSTVYRSVTYFKYRDKNGNLVRDMLPCYRKADGEPGMYDFAEGTFYTNAGTDKFYIGGPISRETLYPSSGNVYDCALAISNSQNDYRNLLLAIPRNATSLKFASGTFHTVGTFKLFAVKEAPCVGDRASTPTDGVSELIYTNDTNYINATISIPSGYEYLTFVNMRGNIATFVFT